MWANIRSTLRNLLHKRQIESELDAEIRSYVDTIVWVKRSLKATSLVGGRKRWNGADCEMEQINEAVRDVRRLTD